MNDDLKTRVEYYIEKLAINTNGLGAAERVDHYSFLCGLGLTLIKDLYAEVQRFQTEVARLKDLSNDLAEANQKCDGENQRLEQENAALREAIKKVNGLVLESFHDAQDSGSIYQNDFGAMLIVLNEALAAKGGEDE